MRVNAALALMAGSLARALPASQDTASTAILPTAPSSDMTVASEQMKQLAAFASETVQAELEGDVQKRGTCNLFNLAVRREWGSLSKTERKSYTNAVLCLQKKGANTPADLVPGAKSRYDDWVATHINQTMTIHYTGTFLAWHRYFTWTYEQALRTECGYTGYQPYWDWSKTAVSGLEASTMLDGSDYSMSGNGALVANQADIILGGTDGLPTIPIPAGTGGGCVQSGPFKDMKVNLGPVALGLPGGETGSNGNGLSWNPRCLKRDLTDYANKKWANASAIVSLILQSKTINDFQMTMQGVPGGGSIGVHGGGHYSLGGDPGRDLFTSPGDPMFWLHHAQIDRTWWVWQQLDKKTRTGADGISGTGTFLDAPPSANTTLQTTIDLNYAAGPVVTMADLMSTTDGPMCYIYL